MEQEKQRQESGANAPGAKEEAILPVSLANRLAESTPNGILTLDAREKVLWANPAAHEILSFPARELTESSLEDIFPPEIADGCRKAIRKKETYRRDFACGNCFPQKSLHLHLINVEKPTEGVVVVILIHDRTSEVLLQESYKAARDAEAHRAAILEGFSDGLRQLHSLLVESHDSIEEFLLSALRVGSTIFKLPLGMISRISDQKYEIRAVWPEGTGLQKGQIFRLEDTFCNHAIEAGRTVSMPHVGVIEEMKCHPAYLALRVEAFIATPIYLEGNLLGSLIFCDLKPREEPFPRWNEEVMEILSRTISREVEMLRSRTALEKGNEELRKKNQELDRFAYVVSHDLKAPLRAIGNLATWIQEDLGEEADEDIVHQLDLMQNRVQRLGNMVDGVLKYSRVGRKDNGTQIVSVSKLLREVVDLLGPPEQCTIHIPDDLPTIQTAYIRLQQVFQNLLSNAISHNDKTNPEIFVEWKPVAEGIEFRVRDNGPGIPGENLENIFEIFRSSGDQKGTGVGLAIVRKSVEEMGGRIWLETNQEEGVTFAFFWPENSKETEKEYFDE